MIEGQFNTTYEIKYINENHNFFVWILKASKKILYSEASHDLNIEPTTIRKSMEFH